MSITQVSRDAERSSEHLANEVLRQVWDLPGYGEERISRDELAALLERNVRGVAQSMRTLGEPSGDTTLTARRIGEARALQGVPIDAMIQSWMTVQRVLVDFVMTDADSLSHADLRRAVAWLGATFASLTRSSIDTYRQTQEEVTAHYDRLSGDLVARLVGAQATDPEDVVRRARVLGADPNAHYTAVAIAAVPSADEATPQIYVRLQREILARVAATVPGRVLIGQTDEYPLLLVPVAASAAAVEADVRQALEASRHRGRALVGASDRVERLPHMAAACQEARDALEAGMRFGYVGHMVNFATVLPEVLLIRSPDVVDRLARTLEPIIHRPELVATLSAYIDCGLSARETARRIFVHPNTVPYRLKVISSLLDRDVSDLSSIIDLTLALRAVRLNGERGGT